MKAKRHIRVICIFAAISCGALLFKISSTAPPVLVLRGYDNSTTNSSQLAKLELRNTTGKTIWLYYSGPEFPLNPPVLERPILVSPEPTNSSRTNVRSLYVGHFFMVGEKVPPGATVHFNVPIRSGESAKQVGLSYYSGSYSNGSELVNSLMSPVSAYPATWKGTAVSYWQRLKRKLNAPQSHEVWCPDVLSFQAGITNLPPKSVD